jgi:hypothetical protein
MEQWNRRRATASRGVVAGVTAQGLEQKKDTEPVNVLLPRTGILPIIAGTFPDRRIAALRRGSGRETKIIKWT